MGGLPEGMLAELPFKLAVSCELREVSAEGCCL